MLHHSLQNQAHSCHQAIAGLLLMALLALCSGGCSPNASDPATRKTPGQPRTTPANSEREITKSSATASSVRDDAPSFVGTAACTECHAAIADTWQQHPMARSMAPAAAFPAGSESAIPVVHGITRSYDARLENGRVLHRDSMLAADGQPVYSQEFAMDYVVGSGQRAHAWIRREGELLFQSPLNWFSQQA
ncbi:MAG: hypothetical protein ACKO2P_06710, partial [Planctomycetota bacterium]